MSERGSVSQTVHFRITIPELPPLVMKRREQSISTGKTGARHIDVSDDGGRQVAHVIDRHGRVYMRQTSATGSGRTTLIAAP